MPRPARAGDVAPALRRSPARSASTSADPGRIFADAVEVDAQFHTSVPGVFATGDLTGAMPSVANAISSGSNAAAMIVHDLMLGA